MSQIHKHGHHSATVALELHVDGRILPLAKAGEHRLTLVTPTSLSPGEARIAMHVDGRTHFLPVELPDGASCESPFVNAVHAGVPIA
ncbi:MAG: hypothetical protein KF861_05180 [Planctomycetaceae bacterium]|nr:hypothetical protein [Planctomycetaceae bacterium]